MSRIWKRIGHFYMWFHYLMCEKLEIGLCEKKKILRKRNRFFFSKMCLLSMKWAFITREERFFGKKWKVLMQIKKKSSHQSHSRTFWVKNSEEGQNMANKPYWSSQRAPLKYYTGGLVIGPYFWLFIRPLFFEVPKWLFIKPYFFLKNLTFFW